MQPRSRSSHGLIILALAIILFASGGSALTASSGLKCRKINGSFTLSAWPSGTPCTSPVGLCGTGVFKGDIKGTSSSAATSILPTADTPATGIAFATSDSTIHTPTGDLFIKDAVVLPVTGEGPFSEVNTIVGGTGAYAGATGRLVASGAYTGAAAGEGTYMGEICTP